MPHVPYRYLKGFRSDVMASYYKSPLRMNVRAPSIFGGGGEIIPDSESASNPRTRTLASHVHSNSVLILFTMSIPNKILRARPPVFHGFRKNITESGFSKNRITEKGETRKGAPSRPGSVCRIGDHVNPLYFIRTHGEYFGAGGRAGTGKTERRSYPSDR